MTCWLPVSRSGPRRLDAAYNNRVITLHSLKATSARAFVSASGTANLDGDIAASVDASNIPLALLKTAVPSAGPYFVPAAVGGQ